MSDLERDIGVAVVELMNDFADAATHAPDGFDVDDATLSFILINPTIPEKLHGEWKIMVKRGD